MQQKRGIYIYKAGTSCNFIFCYYWNRIEQKSSIGKDLQRSSSPTAQPLRLTKKHITEGIVFSLSSWALAGMEHQPPGSFPKCLTTLIIETFPNVQSEPTLVRLCAIPSRSAIAEQEQTLAPPSAFPLQWATKALTFRLLFSKPG